MDEKMNGGISTLRGIFCRLSFQKGGITAETIAAQGFDGGIFSVDTRHSSQASYRLRRVFSFHYKTYRALTLLLLASKPKPSVAGSVWFLAQTCSHCIFFVHIFQVKSYILIL